MLSSSFFFSLLSLQESRVVNPKQFQKEKKNSKKKLQKSRDASTRTQQKREREREIRVLLSFITEVTVFAFSFLPLIYI